MSEALDELKSRAAELVRLQQIENLLFWDQRVLMPPAGARHRAEHSAFLNKRAHETLVSSETERLLRDLEPVQASLDPDSYDFGLIRLIRRRYEKLANVPVELTAELARAGAAGGAVWVQAKAASDFSLFLPALERNVELRRQYIDLFTPVEERYDVLLDDYEPELRTADVARIFTEVREALVPLIAELRDRDVDDSFLTGEYPVQRQAEVAADLVDTLGHRPGAWRVDPTEHPFEASCGRDDVRVTTHYYPDRPKALFSTMHEYGHGLYEHQLPAEVEHLPVGQSVSPAIHESQSRLWENLVGRSLPFWRFYYPRLRARFPEQLAGVDVERWYAAVNRVEPSLIRVEADEVTYGLHVILRFELEQDIVNDRVSLADLPQVWAQRMHDYLGVEVPDDARGVLQDMHWSSGLMGHFSTYLLGSIISVQLWQRMAGDLGDLDALLERGDFAPLRGWLGEHVHAQGSKYTTQELLQKATGSAIDARPYIGYLRAKFSD